ncbi:MAG TPA: sigma 54-interacting transcriptional regulator [Polyangiaceae bacterium]
MPGPSEPVTGVPGSHDRDALEAATARSDDADGTREVVRVLHVTGPSGGTRHVLPMGLVTLGRGAEATIVIVDPRVSRSHAALHVTGREITLTDLGSANGTFVGTARLASGDALPLADGQSFSMGDSVLVVRPTQLREPGARRLSSADEVPARFAASTPLGRPGALVVVRVRPSRPTQSRVLELVLGELFASPRDFMLWESNGRLLLGYEVPSEADAVRIERAVIRQLGSFGVAADVSARAFSANALEKSGDGLRGLLAGDAVRSLARGTVVLEDPAMKALEETVLRVARTPVGVLILGETGSGKDVVAAMLHELSPRSQQPFVALNCASLPESLLESELFGYERGAFTGATNAKPGLFETADGGTVFLDEIGDLPLALQAKLLRVIESHEVARLGAVKPKTVDVRFVAATNRDLRRRIADGHFREDLYYRLNAVTLHVPPLRERRSEIEPLARLFLEKAREHFETGDMHFSAAALGALHEYPWPGNVRELKSAVERAALLARGNVIEPSALGIAAPAFSSPPRASGSSRSPELSTSPDIERERIVRALESCGGNQSRAADVLGMSRRTLVRRIAQLGLPRPRTGR